MIKIIFWFDTLGNIVVTSIKLRQIFLSSKGGKFDKKNDALNQGSST